MCARQGLAPPDPNLPLTTSAWSPPPASLQVTACIACGRHGPRTRVPTVPPPPPPLVFRWVVETFSTRCRAAALAVSITAMRLLSVATLTLPPPSPPPPSMAPPDSSDVGTVSASLETGDSKESSVGYHRRRGGSRRRPRRHHRPRRVQEGPVQQEGARRALRAGAGGDDGDQLQERGGGHDLVETCGSVLAAALSLGLYLY